MKRRTVSLRQLIFLLVIKVTHTVFVYCKLSLIANSLVPPPSTVNVCIMWCMTGVLTRAKKFIFRTLRRLPYIGKQIDAKVNKQSRKMEDEFHETTKGLPYLQKLPDKGVAEVNGSVDFFDVFLFLW